MSGDGAIVGPDSPAWRELLGRLPHGVYHHPDYVSLDADLVGGAPIAWLYREDERAMVLPLVQRPVPGSSWTDVSSPYGYAGPAVDVGAGADGFLSRACARLLADLREFGVLSAFVRFDPMSELQADLFASAGCVVHHGSTVAIDLAQPEEELLASFRRDHRRDIRRARSAGVEMVFDDWSRLPEFVAIYRENMARVAAEEFYFFDDAYFDRLRDALAGQLHLVLAELAGEVVAGALAFEHDGLVQYHLSGTRTDALTLRPSKLMVAELALWARSRGNRAFHLGGGVGGTDDTLFHYKAGFSSWHLPFATLRVVTDGPAYDALVAERNPGADPHDRGGFFPAYRVGLGSPS